MKIVYLTEVDIFKKSNLLDKMNSQIDEWTSHGHEVMVLTLNSSGQNRTTELTKSVDIYYDPIFKYLPRFKNRSVYRLLNKVLSISEIVRMLNQYNPDLVYLREIIAFPFIDRILKDQKVVLEANTLLKHELETKGFFARRFYDLFQENIYKSVSGFIGVTNEISNQFLKYNKPIITITNGIKLSDYTIRNHSINDVTNVIFVGTPGLPWHGFDKFEKMATLMPTINFHLVGPPKKESEISNLTYHGYLETEQLEKLYSNMHIGVGTLALHRKQMEEACPLKVREYMAYGLPCIIAYKDLDLVNQKFVLELPNTENCIEENIELIENFIKSLKGTYVVSETLKPLISIESKEQQRLDFFTSVIHSII